MILNPNSKLPIIQSYSQPITLVYKKLGSIVDEDCCNHYYHDQLAKADPDKWDRAVKFAIEKFPDLGNEKTANFFQTVLREYFEIPIEISGIYTGVSQSDGYQYWVFAVPKKSKTLEIEPNSREIEPNLRQSESDNSPDPLSFLLVLGVFVVMGSFIFNNLGFGSDAMKIYQELKQQNNRSQPPQ